MIVRFFKAGISNGESPVRYLLSNHDHTGTPRAVAPEVLEGSPTGNTTIQIINGIARRHKYVSGVIAFRHNEQPTREQLYQVIDRFKAVAAPLNADQFHSFWALHKDKGNTELHFVFPMVLLGGTSQKGKDLTGQAMNIRPPGPRSEELFTLFQQVMNHELGYAQVAPDPLAVSLASYWHKPAGQVAKRKISLLEQTMLKGVKQGRIGNRDSLCHYLEDQLGVTITRQGEKYLSVKLPGDKKAIRLKGPLFEAAADYPQLMAKRGQMKQSSQLTSSEYKQALQRLNQVVSERASFMRGDYKPPKQQNSTTTRRKHESTKPRRRHKPTQRGNQFPNSANRPTGANRPPTQRSTAIRIGNHTQPMQGTQQAQKHDCGVIGSHGSAEQQWGSGWGRRGIAATAQKLRQQIEQKPPIASGATQAIAKSLISLQVQIDAAQADLANAQTIEERVMAEQKMAELMVQRNRLLAELEQAKVAELNDVFMTRRRPTA